MEVLQRWIVIISDCFFRVTSNLKQIVEAGMSHIMAESTKDKSEHFEGSEDLFGFRSIGE